MIIQSNIDSELYMSRGSDIAEALYDQGLIIEPCNLTAYVAGMTMVA